MKTSIHLVLGAVVALALAAAQQPADAAKKPPAPAAAAAKAEAIDPAAIAALRRMSAYLGTLTAFEIKVANSMDLVRDDGQKIEMAGVSHYLVRRPNNFVIEASSDRKSRQIYYDGKSLTLNAPKLGYYATVAAPATIRETLQLASDRYGLSLPLEDLFRWSEPNNTLADKLQSAMVVGPSTIDGVECDQYAFRGPDVDWQIWIEKGDKPVPRKVVITDRQDSAHPAYSAVLNWNTAPTLASDAFTFVPSKDSHAIKMAVQ